MVQESRILQVCIFETIQRKLASVDFGALKLEEGRSGRARSESYEGRGRKVSSSACSS
jgi:hypothetical protein